MTKIDIMSGFLGAGKTTLIKKLLQEALQGEQVVLIENEFGEIGIDGGFLKDAGIEIKEMNSGCICCSLVGDFGASLKEVLDTYKPDRVIIEPSGVGKLSDVEKAVLSVDTDVDAVLNSKVVVVDATKCKMYAKNFGEFFLDQIEHAGTIVLSRTDKLSDEKLEKAVALMREHNEEATIVTTPWGEVSGADMLDAMEEGDHLLEDMIEEMEHHHHECECGHHHEHDHECGCGHHHDHEHHHHEDGHECSCGCGHDHEHGHHHHEHGHECSCGCGHDHEHGHHHADEVFTSWGMETVTKYSIAEIEAILETLEEEDKYGMILRAKGMVAGLDGNWVYFDYVPGESNVRAGKPDVTGKFCVIGSKLKEDNLAALFAK